MIFMTDKKSVLAIVPARGGSKSIPRKNIKPFCGKPLMAWKIEAAKESGTFDRIIVTTDDEEIAAVGRNSGADVPFLRPTELAEDTTPTLPVLQHAVQWLREHERYEPAAVVLLEPTTPGVRAFHIREALDLFWESGADSVISVLEVPTAYRPPWQFTRSADGRLGLWTGEPIKRGIRRRQDLPLTYHRNSGLYVFRPELLFAEEPSLYGDDVRGYVMGREYSHDLDSPDDWVPAEEALREVLAGR